MRKDLLDLLHEAMNQQELTRDVYHQMAHPAFHPETRETFAYLAKEPEGNKVREILCVPP
jgi:hypothetical protein